MAPGGGGGGDCSSMILNVVVFFFVFFLSAQRSVMLMMIPLPHYDNFLGKNSSQKKICVRVLPTPPPHPPPPPPTPATSFRAGTATAVTRHFATPKQTPWRRTWWPLFTQFHVMIFHWILGSRPWPRSDKRSRRDWGSQSPHSPDQTRTGRMGRVFPRKEHSLPRRGELREELRWRSTSLQLQLTEVSLPVCFSVTYRYAISSEWWPNLVSQKCSMFTRAKKHGCLNTTMNGTVFFLSCHSGSIFSDWNLQFGQDKI